MTEQTADMYASLRSNVGHLGQILGETMQNHLGDAFLEKVEQYYHQRNMN